MWLFLNKTFVPIYTTKKQNKSFYAFSFIYNDNNGLGSIWKCKLLNLGFKVQVFENDTAIISACKQQQHNFV